MEQERWGGKKERQRLQERETDINKRKNRRERRREGERGVKVSKGREVLYRGIFANLDLALTLAPWSISSLTMSA